MLNYCRRGDNGRAHGLLGEVAEAVKADPSGPHAWLLPMRLGQAQAELLAAEQDWSGAMIATDETLKRARQVGRPKYESLALLTRGMALLGLDKKREAIAQFQAASEVARRLGDPAIFLHVAAAQLAAEAEEGLSLEARGALDAILGRLPDSTIRLSQSSEAVRLVYRLTVAIRLKPVTAGVTSCSEDSQPSTSDLETKLGRAGCCAACHRLVSAKCRLLNIMWMASSQRCEVVTPGE
jgi:tetratricopeptide (TPR) repeat protein